MTCEEPMLRRMLLGVVCGLALSTRPGHREVPLPRRPLTLDAVIQLGINRSTDAMRSAARAGSRDVRDAALEAQSALVLAAASFSGELQVPPAALGAPGRLVLERAQALLAGLGADRPNAMTVRGLADAVVAACGLRDRHPIVRSFTTGVIGDSGTTTLRIHGTFPGRFIRRPPILTLRGRRVTGAVLDGRVVVYTLPRYSAGREMFVTSADEGLLEIPWSAGWWYEVRRGGEASVARYVLAGF